MLRNQLFAAAGTLSIAAALLFVSAGCGSHDALDPEIHPRPDTTDEDGAEPATDVTVRAEEFTFIPDKIAIPAGQTVTIMLQNDGEVEHDLQVDGLTIEPSGDMDMTGDHGGADAETVALHTAPGETAELTFITEQTGTFEFYCTIDDHRDTGMVGTFTVE